MRKQDGIEVAGLAPGGLQVARGKGIRIAERRDGVPGIRDGHFVLDGARNGNADIRDGECLGGRPDHLCRRGAAQHGFERNLEVTGNHATERIGIAIRAVRSLTAEQCLMESLHEFRWRSQRVDRRREIDPVHLPAHVIRQRLGKIGNQVMEMSDFIALTMAENRRHGFPPSRIEENAALPNEPARNSRPTRKLSIHLSLRRDESFMAQLNRHENQREHTALGHPAFGVSMLAHFLHHHMQTR